MPNPLNKEAPRVKKLLKIDYPPPKVVAFTPILWLRHRNF
jgi:hypothetical protein